MGVSKKKKKMNGHWTILPFGGVWMKKIAPGSTRFIQR